MKNEKRDGQNSHSRDYKKIKRKNHLKMVLAMSIGIILFVVLLLVLILMIVNPDKDEFLLLTPEPVTEASGSVSAADESEFSEEELSEEETEDSAEGQDANHPVLKETDIYTFLQGPRSWEGKVDWSGSWCYEVLADQEFSVFGCGLCDLANIYSTLTPYDCSPIDMYWYAQEASKYTPVSGFGAIDWPYLKKTLSSVGISSSIRRKDKTYEQFRQRIANAITAIVLVCSDNDDTYWQNVEGHYVNIWLYDETDDTVFLADSGNPDHNRRRIPLRFVYEALKTYSNYQYLLVTGVDETKNTWQHDGIHIKWKKPKYYKVR